MNMEPLRNKIEIHFADIMIAGDIKLEVITIGLWGNEKMLVEEGGYPFTDKKVMN